MDTVVTKVRGRLIALGEAHRISISVGRQAGACSDLHDMITAILKPYDTDGSGRIVLSGPIFDVPREAVTPLGLTLHELATNAVKYGALSREDGTITVAWVRKDDRLSLTWTEKGGPPVAMSSIGGTGTRMTESVLRTIGARLIYDWCQAGLEVTLDMPLDT